MELVYAPMDIGDYDDVYALWRATPGVGLSEADSREGIARYLAANPEQSFVCRAGGRLVGAILCGNDGRRAYIHHLAVARDFRRRGVGSRLLALALTRQKELGMGKCHLFIFRDNNDGRAFWLRKGFVQREDIAILSRGLSGSDPL